MKSFCAFFIFIGVFTPFLTVAAVENRDDDRSDHYPQQFAQKQQIQQQKQYFSSTLKNGFIPINKRQATRPEYEQQNLRVLPPFNSPPPPQNTLGYYGNPQQPIRKQQYRAKIPQQQQQQQNNKEQLTSSEERELEEEEQNQQPDRLTELLATSKFSCQGKKDGYYADDGLNCEVFHYCQDNGKHSWLCPNQFAFHQIHLICVPPSSDNICKQSSNYHFVNDYLYKAVNEKEANAYNTSLKYADRFFPEGYQSGGAELMPYDETSESDEPQQQFRQQNYKPNNNEQVYRPNQQNRPQNNYNNNRPQQQASNNVNSYFTNPEHINIPLNQRRPVPKF